MSNFAERVHAAALAAYAAIPYSADHPETWRDIGHDACVFVSMVDEAIREFEDAEFLLPDDVVDAVEEGGDSDEQFS